ncbi:Organic cation transporter-like protein [Chionoecetes opilio]|uniref:Organic cation transporter-like protein n=1 Tax=Chionoecetes opilio TaxID=41210 RepID=A0A8J4XMY0_CHIOP|nr:Organic cation transporter-like protein [Chionoecetes opilio]
MQDHGNATPITPMANHSTGLHAEDECKYRIDTPEGVQLEDCLEFDFDNSTFTSTLTAEYNLVCGRAYLQSTYQSLYMFGVFVGAPINGYLSDKYGRKSTVVLGVIAYMVISFVSAWLPFISLIFIARFLLGSLHAVCCYTSYILSKLIDESPRWLIVNGRSKEALRILSKVARWHSLELPREAEMKKMIEDQDPEVQDPPQKSSMRVLHKSIIKEALVLVRTPQLRIITLIVYLDYLMGSMVYFGLSLSGGSISDNPFTYMVLSGLVEVPAYIFTSFIVQRFGRKPTLAFFMLFSAANLLCLAVIPAAYSTTIVALAMVGKLGITAGFQTIIFYSSELFPTQVRSRGMGTSYMMSRIGSMVSPFITDLVGTIYPWAPFVIFGTGALLAGAGTFLLPETRGQVLPDTIAQLEARAREERKK